MDYKTEARCHQRRPRQAARRRHAARLLRGAVGRRHAARRLCQRGRARQDRNGGADGRGRGARPAGARHPRRRCAASARASRCPRWAKARSATSVRRAACAAGISGHESKHSALAPGLRTQRRARQPRALLRHRLRSAPQRRGGGLRRRRQDLDAGLAHPARAAGRRQAARDPGDHLHQEGGGRNAPAPARVAGRVCAWPRPRRWPQALAARGMPAADGARSARR